MKPLIKYFSLPAGQREAFKRAFKEVVRLRILLKKKPFPEFKAWFKTEAESRAKKGNAFDLETILLANRRACKYFVPKERPCLFQALAGYLQCRENGIQTSVVIGVMQNEDGFQAHAWLVKGEEILLGNLPNLNEFNEITRFENL